MKRHHITLGCKTTAGGIVTSAGSTMDIHGKTMAVEGDTVACPACRSIGKIACKGSRLTETWCGKAVALEDDLCMCGCSPPPKLMPSQRARYQELKGSGQEAGSTSSDPHDAPSQGQPRYDEQFLFELIGDVRLPGAAYRLTFEDGSIVEGKTDDQGLTRRIETNVPLRVVKGELFSTPGTSSCCSVKPDPNQIKSIQFTGSSLATNAVNVGSSVRKITIEPHSRPLTAGEIAMSRQLFGDSIDYAKVRVHDHGFFWFNLQSRNIAMTPNGEIYFHPDDYVPDFSVVTPDWKRLFMHEMVHVWQRQLGFLVWLHGSMRFALTYGYVLRKGMKLRDYNMEAQGDLLADYFALKFLKRPDDMAQKQYASDLQLFEEVLHEFLSNPAETDNLPGGQPSPPGRGVYDN